MSSFLKNAKSLIIPFILSFVLSTSGFTQHEGGMRILDEGDLIWADEFEGTGVPDESKWERQESQDLIFANNYVKNGGSGPIWGTGARRVIMANNIVDGANDIGLDLEWCADSVITGNTVRNAHEAGIALFYSCHRVSITGNTVINDMEITEGEAKRSWYVRSGIWLTYPNRDVFKNDFGHQDVTITGNTFTGLSESAVKATGYCPRLVVTGNAIADISRTQAGQHPALDLGRSKPLLGPNALETAKP